MSAEQGASAGHAQDTEQQAPLFTVLRGNPTEEELAALTTLLVAARGQEQASAGQRLADGVGRALARRQRIGAGLRPGPGSWRRARPR